jgi:hypothetical protein
MMHNIVKIIVAGGIATTLQRTVGLNPISIEGFAFFMIVFVMISFIWQYFFSKKEVTTQSVEELNKSRVKNKDNGKRIGLKLLKILFVLVIISILNAVINFLSFKLSLFDSEFKYRYDTSKAIALSLKEDTQKTFKIGKFYYSLYKSKNKFYLVKRLDSSVKQKVLTLYSNISLSSVYEKLKDESNFDSILKNISPTVYEEVSLSSLLFKPLWFSNSIEHIYWSAEDYEKYKNKYDKYIKNKKRVLKEKRYKYLLNQDLNKLNEKELESTIKEIYTFYAYTRDTRYIIKLFDELENRSKSKKEGIKVHIYQFEFMKYLYLFRTKEKLNGILKNYEMGVVYTFTFLKNQPLDIPKQKYSHLRLVDLKNNKRYLLSGHSLDKIKVDKNSLVITLKDKTKIILDKFKSKDLMPIKIKMTAMISTIYSMEKNFNQIKKDIYE